MVTGQIEIDGTSVRSGSFTVDMASIASDESRRDGQFRGRIMDVGTFPTSTFQLTEPKAVTFELEAERANGTLRILGTIPIVFSEWGIPNPSGGPATTEEDGELEFLLVFARA